LNHVHLTPRPYTTLYRSRRLLNTKSKNESPNAQKSPIADGPKASFPSRPIHVRHVQLLLPNVHLNRQLPKPPNLSQRLDRAHVRSEEHTSELQSQSKLVC